MTRIEKILEAARDTLADSSKTRWSDAVLLRLLSEGQNNIALKAELFQGTAFIPFESGVSIYKTPSDLIELEDVVYNNASLCFSTTHKIKRGYGADWRCHYTDTRVTHIIFDKLNAQEFRVYPTPFFTLPTETYPLSDFGVVESVNGISGDDVFGVVTDLRDPCTKYIFEQFGVTTEFTPVIGVMLEYVKGTKALTSVSDSLELPEVYDEALKHYVAGKALRNDTKSSNRAMGNEELGFYADILWEITDNASLENVSHNNFSTSYNGMG